MSQDRKRQWVIAHAATLGITDDIFAPVTALSCCTAEGAMAPGAHSNTSPEPRDRCSGRGGSVGLLPESLSDDDDEV